MITKRDDDYLICREYMERMDQVSSEFPDFITFQHPNQNWYFAWVNNNDILLRSEAYPDEERMIRGIKAIIKNRDFIERYSVDSAHGVHFLVLWGGGDHQAHTGNMESHNEIGRSCPRKSREEIYNMLLFKGKEFADKVAPLALAGAAVAAIPVVADAIMHKTTPSAAAAVVEEGGSGFNWKWLLPLLLLIPLFLWWKSCNATKGSDADLSGATTEVPATPVDTAAQVQATNVENPAPPAPSAPDCDLNWIFFDYDQYDIRSDAKDELQTLADILKKNADYTAELSAHTDAKGTDEYNANLSGNRANAAKNALVALGIESSRIVTSANSEAQPIAANTEDDSGRHYNRRVELRVKDKTGKEVCKSIPPAVPSNLKQ